MIGVLTTTRNEVESVGYLGYHIAMNGFRWVVIDENSQDGTLEHARNAGAEVHHVASGTGIARSLMCGWNVLLSDKTITRIVQIDAGFSHSMEDVNGLLGVDADIVIGSRFLPGSRYYGLPSRRLLSQVASRMCNLASGKNLSDWTSGYRVFTREAVRQLLNVPGYTGRMHDWQIEVVRRAFELGMSIGETPISYMASRSSLNARTAWAAFQQWRQLWKLP